MIEARPSLAKPFAIAFAAHAVLALWFVWTRSAGTDAAATGFPLDDAWIHMVYGRSFAGHLVPTYNDTAEAGFSSPLWLLVLAVAHWCSAILPLGPVFFAKLFGVLCASATTTAIYGLGARLSRSPAVGVVAAGLCAANPVLAFAQVSGMEVSLTTATGAWALLALADQRYRRAGGLLALAYWSRPECLLLAGFAIAAGVAEGVATPRERTRRAMQLAWPTAVAVLLWCGYCLAATGHPLPNTFYAKFDLTGQESILPVAIELLRRLPTNGWGLGVVLAAAALLRAHKTTRPWLTALVVVYPFAFLLAIVRTRPCPLSAGEYFYFARYPAPAWPFLMLGVALGAQALVRLAADFAWSRARLPLHLVTAALLLTMLAAHPRALLRATEQYAWNCQNLAEVQIAFGRWVAANVPAGRAVAINDAGAIRYFGGREAVDLMGLNDRAILFSAGFGRGGQTAESLAALLRARQVDTAIIFPPWFGGLCRQPTFADHFVEVAAFASAHYTVADPRSGQTRMVAYRLLPTAPARPPR